MHSSKRVVARGDTGDRPAFHDSSSRSAAVVQAEKASAVERDDPRGIHHGGRRLSGHVGAADVLACPMSLEPGAENTDRQMALRELAQAQIRRECRRWDFDWDAFVADCPEWGITEVVHRRAVQQEREANRRSNGYRVECGAWCYCRVDSATGVAADGWMSASPSPSARVLACAVSSRPYPSLALFASYSYHGFITDREGETPELRVAT